MKIYNPYAISCYILYVFLSLKNEKNSIIKAEEKDILIEIYFNHS